MARTGGKCGLVGNITAGVLKSLILVLIPGFFLWQFSSIVSGPASFSPGKALAYATGITVLFTVISIVECRLPIPFAVIARLSNYAVAFVIAYWWGSQPYFLDFPRENVTATVNFERIAVMYMLYIAIIGIIDLSLLPVERIMNSD